MGITGGRDLFKEPGWNDPPLASQSGASDPFGGEQFHEIDIRSSSQSNPFPNDVLIRIRNGLGHLVNSCGLQPHSSTSSNTLPPTPPPPPPPPPPPLK